MKRIQLATACLLLTGCTAKAEIGPDVHAYDVGVDAEVADSGTEAAPDPVTPDAGHTQGAGYTTNDQTCSLFYDAGVTSVWYAQQTYPDASASDLMNVTAWVHLQPGSPDFIAIPSGFALMSQPVIARDGVTAVMCPQGYTVTFARPQ